MLDSTCSRCGSGAETICHVLFHCEVAKRVWERSRIPLLNGGFSVSSVWLNIYHLFTVSKKLPQENEVRLSFPWILWQLWKARNSFCFEERRMDDRDIFPKPLMKQLLGYLFNLLMQMDHLLKGQIMEAVVIGRNRRKDSLNVMFLFHG